MPPYPGSAVPPAQKSADGKDSRREEDKDDSRSNHSGSSSEDDDKDDNLDPADDSGDDYREGGRSKSQPKKSAASKTSKKREKKRRKLNPAEESTDVAGTSANDPQANSSIRPPVAQQHPAPPQQTPVPYPMQPQQVPAYPSVTPPTYGGQPQYGGYFMHPPHIQQQYGYDPQGGSYYPPPPHPQTPMYSGYEHQAGHGMYYPPPNVQRPPPPPHGHPSQYGGFNMHPTYGPAPGQPPAPYQYGAPPPPVPMQSAYGGHPPPPGGWGYSHGLHPAPVPAPAPQHNDWGYPPSNPSVGYDGNTQGPQSGHSVNQPPAVSDANSETPSGSRSEPAPSHGSGQLPPSLNFSYPPQPPQTEQGVSSGGGNSGNSTYMPFPQQNAGPASASGDNNWSSWGQNTSASPPGGEYTSQSGAYPARSQNQPYVPSQSGDRIQLAPLRTNGVSSTRQPSSASPVPPFSAIKDRDRTARENVTSISSLRSNNDRYKEIRPYQQQQSPQSSVRDWDRDFAGASSRASGTGTTSGREENERRRHNPLSIGSIIDEGS
jgi:hypothetical protein